MANITLLGASYTDVPAVDLPQTGGGTVRFVEENNDLVSVLEKTTVSISNSDVTTIGYQLFASNSVLESVDFPNVTYVDNYAFRYCSALTNVNLPSLLQVRSSVFQGCSTLAKIDLPSVDSIYSTAFSGCSALGAVILRREDVVYLANADAFSGADNAIIYVPDNLVDSYKANTRWSAYTSRIKGLSEYTG